jgi:hypothetical protein
LDAGAAERGVVNCAAAGDAAHSSATAAAAIRRPHRTRNVDCVILPVDREQPAGVARQSDSVAPSYPKPGAESPDAVAK